MKAIILAAGFGRRLQPITNTVPKSMVPVKGIPLILRSMNKIAALGVKEIIIVTGHMAGYISDHLGDSYKGIPIRYVENTVYETTNNIYSLWMASGLVEDDTYLFECDLIYSEKLLSALEKSAADCSIVTSDFNKETMDGSVIQIDGAQNAVDLYLKKEQNEAFNYSDKRKTVNIYKFSADFWRNAMVPALNKEIASGNKNSYYELVLKEIMHSGNWNMKVVNVPEEYWCEIDDMEDLKRAEGSDLL